MVVGSLLLASLVAGNVIAAPSGIDQPPTDSLTVPTTVALLLLAPVSAIVILRFRWHRLSAAPPRPPVFAPELSFALVALMLLFGAIGTFLAVRAFGIEVQDDWKPELSEQAALALGAYLAQSSVLAVYVSVLRARRGASPGTAPGFPLARAAGVGGLALLVTWPLVNAAGWIAATIITRFGGPAPRVIAHDTLQLLIDSPGGVWFCVLTGLVVVAAPVLEELLYRGLLQDALRRLGLGPWPAIAVTSVAFAAMHWDNTAPHAVVGLFVLSLGFGWAFERTGRLTASISMHVLFNLANISLALANH